jgi:hypothetical protein
MNENLSVTEILTYVALVALMIAGIVLRVAPTGVLSGLGAGAIVAIYFFLRSRKPRDSG